MGKLSCNTHKKITITTEKSHSYNHIISLHCTHISTIRCDKTYKIRRSVQIPIRLGIFMHKVTHSQLPQNMSSMFLRTDKLHSHKLRNQNAYYIEQIRTNTRKSTINFSGPTYWNMLPVNLRQIVSIHLFKKKLKELIQSKYP